VVADAFEPISSPAVADDGEARFRNVYQENFSQIYAYFVRRADGQEVADLVSEVFVVAWRRLDHIPPAPEDRLWLYGVARRVMSQHGRAVLRRKQLTARIAQNVGSQGFENSDAEKSSASSALGLVDRLRPRDREVVRLLIWERLSHAEAATVLGCTTNAVTIRWHRSLKHLRRKLDAPTVATTETRPGGF